MSELASAQLERADFFGRRARFYGRPCLPYRCDRLMGMIGDRVGDTTPADEAPSALMIAAWLEGWKSGNDVTARTDPEYTGGNTLEKALSSPYRQPREGHLGEAVFVEQWRAYLAGEGDIDCTPLELVLGRWQSLRQARVASSFICWLGTSMGRSLLDEAERLRGLGLRNPHYHAWAVFTMSQRRVNFGVRPIETILATAEHMGKVGSIGWGVVKPVPYSADDLETIEAVTVWLSTLDGQEFIERCEVALRQRELAQRAERITASR